jgi:hypothetical protein
MFHLHAKKDLESGEPYMRKDDMFAGRFLASEPWGALKRGRCHCKEAFSYTEPLPHNQPLLFRELSLFRESLLFGKTAVTDKHHRCWKPWPMQEAIVSTRIVVIADTRYSSYSSCFLSLRGDRRSSGECSCFKHNVS